VVADATLQLARLLWNDGQLQDALGLLQDPPKGFEAQFLVLRGDVLLTQGQGQAAREAWDQAMQATKDPGLRVELQQKKAVWP
jgi:predicted negative regulator of RcsB-dependent stress response